MSDLAKELRRGASPWAPEKQDNRPQRGAWAPGNYICECAVCGSKFVGDKRAKSCADCAFRDLPPPPPGDEAEMREALAKAYSDAGLGGAFLRTERPLSSSWQAVFAAMRTYAAQVSSRARREAMEEYGWSLWEGGECPLPPDARVECKSRGAGQFDPCLAQELDWSWGENENPGDIVAYRVVQPSPPPPPADALDRLVTLRELIEALRDATKHDPFPCHANLADALERSARGGEG